MSLLFECEAARIDVGGAPLVEGLTLGAEGRRVALIGDWRALFALLGGSARVTAGRVTLLGVDAAQAVPKGLVGLALCDPELPGEWTSERYLTEAALLGGGSRRRATDTERAVVASLGLAELHGRRIKSLGLAEKRALGMALAVIETPPLLAVEDPFGGVDDRSLDWLAAVIERAAAGRALMLSSSAPAATGAEHALLARSDAAFLLEAGTLVAQGELASLLGPTNRYVVSVTANGAELATRLGQQGLAVQVAQPSGGFGPATAELAGRTSASRLLVELPDPARTDFILDAALAVRAPILELRPLRVAPPREP